MATILRQCFWGHSSADLVKKFFLSFSEHRCKVGQRCCSAHNYVSTKHENSVRIQWSKDSAVPRIDKNDWSAIQKSNEMLLEIWIVEPIIRSM